MGQGTVRQFFFSEIANLAIKPIAIEVSDSDKATSRPGQAWPDQDLAQA